jgi:hypothetical protein
MAASPLHRRFPLSIFNPGCGYPLVMKLGVFSEYLISLRLPKKIKSKPQACFRLLSMTGINHLLLLRESLYSYCKVANKLPNLEILNDGSLDARDIHDAIAFWPSQVNIFTKAHVFAELSSHAALPYLEQLSAANPLGLKLSFILARSKYGPQLFADADILWRADPFHLLESELSNCKLAIGREDALSINYDLASSFAPCIIEQPGPNSGCVWSQTDIAELANLLQLLQASLHDIDNNFNEQTILAVLASLHGCFLPEHFCVTYFSDRFKLFKRYPTGLNYCARHYVNILRHLFYLDALMLSLMSLLPRHKSRTCIC